MDDSEHVCPLCCEELDMSDRNFYPCKCGYQVCMWCWHRIRESESGLCPACRTPYGEDPHEFTALDVEEVLKANKEAQAAAKRERHHQTHSVPSNNENEQDSHSAASSDLPKDRTQLANMRVIRRNLVYAVGLPVSIASEDVLRKPEYFGQYGRIAKIVLNRAQVVQEGNDPRRASASAYVTFQHKQDTLSCILALDGFYLDNRSVRASYGTSKYCSAFIKSVRCNNPDCTYLHELGAPEDTFTKQEIQAGYVTSGRDVLARQQQILAEQLKEQSGTGNFNIAPRKRTGGGGPSGTGRASTTPVFPPPEYDEPSKSSQPMVPPPAGVTRASTTQSMSAALLNPATIPGKLGRSSSVGTSVGRSSMPVAPRKSMSNATLGTTAASVVAGGRPSTKEVPENAHSTLTPLTPLKRSSVKSIGAVKPIAEEGGNILGRKPGVSRPSNKGSSGSSKTGGVVRNTVIGGDVIRGVKATSTSSSEFTGGLSLLGGMPIATCKETVSETKGRATAKLPGGDIYTGSLGGNSYSSTSAIGSSLVGGAGLPSTTGLSSAPSTSFWAGGGGADLAPGRTSSNGVIGSRASIGMQNKSGKSSTELATMLGINLPTGSGSLQESTSLWSTAPNNTSQTPSPLSALNGSAHHPTIQNNVYGLREISQPNVGNSALIGGLPIGGGFSGSGGAHSGTSKNDMALLQSLLPGVNVTADNRSLGGIGCMTSAQTTSIGGDAALSHQGSWSSQNGNHVESASSFGAIGRNNGQQRTGQQGPRMW